MNYKNKKIFKTLGSALKSISFEMIDTEEKKEKDENLNDLANILSDIKIEEERNLNQVFRKKSTNKKKSKSPKKKKSPKKTDSSPKKTMCLKKYSHKNKTREWIFLV